jgi:hypothetical protein
MFDVFYLDRPTGLFPHEKKANSIEDAVLKSRTRSCWVINYLCDYSDFDFLWEPLPHQKDQTHVWPSQHQSNSGTWLVPKISGTAEFNRDHTIVKRVKSAPRIYIKHNPNTEDQGNINVRYISSYLGTMRRALQKITSEYCWVTADVCDYSNFDFTWHPSEWQADMLHVFASGEQKFGDTFYVHVPSFLQKTENLATMGWFETLHFVEGISVPRYPMPAIKYNTDSVVPAVWSYEFDDPLVQFYKNDILFEPDISLWEEKTKTVVPLSKGAENVVVPRECKNYLKTQIYDYPYIDKSIQNLRDSQPLDVVFISNGESNAEENWRILQRAVSKGPNRLVRVDGITGRVAAYRAALEVSNTDWAFCVFAKLAVDFGFDWSWQPDRMQEPKHYIFHAMNPVNGLVYGHMAVIAYNKKLVMENTAPGLDFTLDQAHEVVPALSGVAHYADTPWMAWRTAFREVIKLKASLPDVESEYRLRHWLTVGWLENGKWSIIGAQDAVEYYDSVNGDFFELRKSYEWTWLSSYVFVKHGLSPD